MAWGDVPLQIQNDGEGQDISGVFWKYCIWEVVKTTTLFMWQPQPTVRIHGYRPPRSGPLLSNQFIWWSRQTWNSWGVCRKPKEEFLGRLANEFIKLYQTKALAYCLKIHFVMSPCFWDKIHGLSMYNTLFSSVNPRLGHHHCSLIPEHSNIPKRNTVPIKPSPLLFSFTHVFLLASEFLLKTRLFHVLIF